MGRIPDLDEFYYNNRYCPECGGHQKNCEHFWAGHIVGKQFGIMLERERIINLLVAQFDKSWSVSSREELETFIKGETE